MRYFALRMIKWFFYVLAALQVIAGGLAVVQIASATGGQTPAITQPVQTNAWGQPVQSQATTTQAVNANQFQGQALANMPAFFSQNPAWSIIGVILFTLISAFLTIAVAQIISVVIDIADNTHRAALALEKS